MIRFTEFINTASERLAAELISSDAIFHLEMVAEGDKMAARFTMRGTHLGTFFGTPSTGKKIAVQAPNIYRLSGGQIIEETGQPDLFGLLQQIGAIRAK